MAFNSYTGIYEAKLDTKCRIVIPQSFRNELGEDFKIFLAFNRKCLYIMDNKKYNETSYKLSQLSFKRYSTMSKMIHGYCFSVKPDKQGRIVLPPQLRKRINLDVGSDVTILGLGMYIEIWQSEKYEQAFDEITPEDIEEVESYIDLSDREELVVEDHPPVLE